MVQCTYLSLSAIGCTFHTFYMTANKVMQQLTPYTDSLFQNTARFSHVKYQAIICNN